MRVQWRPLGNGWEATIGDWVVRVESDGESWRWRVGLGLGGFSEVHGGACGTWRLARRMGVAAARVLAREDDRRSPWLPGVPADPEPPASLTATAAAHVRTYLRLEAAFARGLWGAAERAQWDALPRWLRLAGLLQDALDEKRAHLQALVDAVECAETQGSEGES